MAVGYDVPATSSWGSTLKMPARSVTVRSPGSLRPDSTWETATRDIGEPVGQLLLGEPQLGPMGRRSRPGLVGQVFRHVPTHLADDPASTG